MQSRMHIQEHQTTVACVDSYTDGILEGRFYHPNHTEAEPFHCLGQFLLKLNQALDQMNLPQSFTRPRAFASPATPQDIGALSPKFQEGALATFSVRVLFRQNSSWQGTVHWLDGQDEQPFRSALELLLLMDSALCKVQATQDSQLA